MVDNINVLLIYNKNSNVYNIIMINKKFIKVNNIFMDVLGMDESYFKILKKKYENGEKYYSLFFSPKTIINLQLSKLKNF